MPEQAFATIKVKLGHPTGEYRRSGHLFTVAEPVILPADEVTLEMMKDDWLVISFDADAPAEGLEVMTRAALDAHALSLGIDTSDAKNKGEAIDRIKAATPAAPATVSTETLTDLQAELATVTAERDAALEAQKAAEAEREAAKEELGKLTSTSVSSHNATASSTAGSPHAHQAAPSAASPSPGDGSDKTAGTVSGTSTVNPSNATVVPPASEGGAKS